MNDRSRCVRSLHPACGFPAHPLTLCDQEWDRIRNARTDALDAVLDALGAQAVPPEFHSVSADSSPFGSQHGSEDGGLAADDGADDDTDATPFGPPRASPSPSPRLSPTDTVRNRSPLARRAEKERRRADRGRWKTLRDFVNERAIEDLLDTIEEDRRGLDVSALGCFVAGLAMRI